MADEEQAREVLLDKAWQLWADRGWAAVTLDVAAAEAGVDPAGFREEFPDDIDLLGEVFDLSSEIRGVKRPGSCGDS